MKFTARLLIAAALLLGSGCAKQDWIDRTLVTVDVTGTWEGSVSGVPGYGSPRDLLFELVQQGATVKGFMRLPSGGSSSAAGYSRVNPGPIDGTVAGDALRFRLTNSSLEGELTVSGDEMNGTVSISGTRPLFLRRVDPSSLSGSPPR
jgi:hypothetical protein